MRNPQHPTPLSDAALANDWPEFAEQVEAILPAELVPAWRDMRSRIYERLLRGKVDYGDASFLLRMSALLDEIKQECLDVGGWAFIGRCVSDDAAMLTIAHEGVRAYAQVMRVEEYMRSLPKSLKPDDPPRGLNCIPMR